MWEYTQKQLIPNLPPIEETVLDSGMIMRRYIVETGDDGTVSERFLEERSLDENGNNTDQIQVRP
jgi:hypothetical protein